MLSTVLTLSGLLNEPGLIASTISLLNVHTETLRDKASSDKGSEELSPHIVPLHPDPVTGPAVAGGLVEGVGVGDGP